MLSVSLPSPPTSVGPEMYERRGYELQIGGYNKSSTGGDSMEYHNGMDFSTYDEDNDGASGTSLKGLPGGEKAGNDVIIASLLWTP